MYSDIVTTFIGSTLAFIFGVLLFVIRENRAKCAKRDTAIRTLIFLIRDLADNLEHDPDVFGHISPDSIGDYLPLIAKNETICKAMMRFNCLYRQWKNRNYLPGGVKSPDVVRDRQDLKAEAEELEHLENKKRISPGKLFKQTLVKSRRLGLKLRKTMHVS